MAFIPLFAPPRVFCLLLGAACLSIAGAAAFPSPQRIMPPFRRVFDQVHRVAQVPVLLPTTLRSKFYCSLDTLTKSEYDIDMDFTPNCHGATPCTLGSLSGMKSRSSTTYGTTQHPLDTDKDADPPNLPVTLARGIKGCYSEGRVGSPSFVYWNRNGYSYAAGFKGEKEDLIQMANSAILNVR